MKNKILIFIIGVLVGAIIATVFFYFYARNLNVSKGAIQQGQNGEVPPMMQQEGGGNRPEKPTEDQSGIEQGTPPQMQTNQETNI